MCVFSVVSRGLGTYQIHAIGLRGEALFVHHDRHRRELRFLPRARLDELGQNVLQQGP